MRCYSACMKTNTTNLYPIFTNPCLKRQWS